MGLILMVIVFKQKSFAEKLHAGPIIHQFNNHLNWVLSQSLCENKAFDMLLLAVLWQSIDRC